MNDIIYISEKRRKWLESLPDGTPCDHPGCLSHMSHPCEGCGRVGGVRIPRKIGFLWQFNFMRPLFWKEAQYWKDHSLPFGWSIIAEPEEGADESDYEKLISQTKYIMGGIRSHE